MGCAGRLKSISEKKLITAATITGNTVAYNTFGHCYFMEDGGEKNNTFHHNLGLLTKRMTPDLLDRNGTIPSDRMPSTFWITSPLSVLTENSAAGSDGMGIWYIFASRLTKFRYRRSLLIVQ